MIADRLRRLDIRKTSARGHGSLATESELDAFIKREVANGVGTDDFIEAVSWCKTPQVATAIQEIFTKTDDIDNLLAALPGIEDKPLIKARLDKFLEALPAGEGEYGDGYNLLVALATRLGKDSFPSFKKYLSVASAQRVQSAQVAAKHAQESLSEREFQDLNELIEAGHRKPEPAK
jgi:hypothetical protein